MARYPGYADCCSAETAEPSRHVQLQQKLSGVAQAWPGCRVLAAAGGFLHCSNIGAGLLAVAGSLPGGVSPVSTVCPVSTVSTLECLLTQLDNTSSCGHTRL